MRRARLQCSAAHANEYHIAIPQQTGGVAIINSEADK
jgi:hypothetical protein